MGWASALSAYQDLLDREAMIVRDGKIITLPALPTVPEKCEVCGVNPPDKLVCSLTEKATFPDKYVCESCLFHFQMPQPRCEYCDRRREQYGRPTEHGFG